MRRHIGATLLLALLAIMVLSGAISGCGASRTAKQVATQVPQTGAQPLATNASAPPTRASATPEDATAGPEQPLSNLARLAPLHMTSLWVQKKGEAVTNTLSYEADLDARGNQHITLSPD